ncbi:MAG: putative rane associated protein [Gammaproteobacteria bacterium]|jgi:hypothetical protein|nr:putative rane associated protein [Gammaproteobacteria bacterium]
MRRLQKYVFLFFIVMPAFLAGCASVVGPSRLGISDAEWKSYTPEQRAELSANYARAQHTKRGQYVKAGNSVIQVNIHGGRALIPPSPDLQAYQPVDFRIREGECHREISIISDLNPRQKTKVTTCYSEHVLYLDASPYDVDKAYGTVLLRFMPMWKRGFTYPSVNTTGLARLTGVNISIKELSPSTDEEE